MKLKTALFLTVSSALLCSCHQDNSNNGTNQAEQNTDSNSESSIHDGASDSDTDQTEEEILPAQDIAGTALFFKSDRQNFYDFPFPADHRRTADGHIDISDFPNDASIVYEYLKLINQEVYGFSNNGAAYFHFDEALSENSIPTPEQSLEATSVIKLINIDPQSENYGRQTPVMCQYFAEEGAFNPTNILAVMPYPGFPLDPETTYAIVINRSMGDINNEDLGSPALLQTALRGLPVKSSSNKKIVDSFIPLASYLEEHQIDPETIAAATVFTTQDPTTDLRKIYKFINERPAPVIQGYKRVNTYSSYYTVDAYYFAPNYQQGKKPYLAEGGGFAFDESGKPIMATEKEYMLMHFSIPRDNSKMPEKGWPLVMIAHGTGGRYNNYEWNGPLTRSRLLTDYGMAAVGISQPLHYERGCTDANTDTDISKCKINSDLLELAAFNVANPASGRTSFRQSAADTFQLVKMLIDNPPVIPADQTPDGKEVKFDTSNLLFHGHSHGGISGAIAMGIEHRVKTSVHSGAGGLLIGTIAHSDLYNAMAKSFMFLHENEELTLLHPAMMVVQTAADVTDPINYAPYYLKKAPAGEGHNILFSIGLYDGDTPYQTNDYLTVAAGIPIVGPQRWEVKGRDLLKMTAQNQTVAQNCQAADGTKYTCGIRQYGIEDDPNSCQGYTSSQLQDYCGHFVMFDKTDAAHMYTEFFYSYLNSDQTIINPNWTEADSLLNNL